jgi:D-alanyl-D-alanine carboxypeptidase
MVATPNRARIEEILAELGMTPAHPRLARLTAFDEATGLVAARCRVTGEVHQLTPAAAAQWQVLADEADAAGIRLELISGFRSYAYQRDLIRRKQEAGRTLEDILQSIAPPGFSEHHTGEAADIGCPGCDDLSASFAGSAAFRWLEANAGRMGWTMSYQAGNEFGYVYEPWHWKWNPSPRTP